MSFHGKAHQNPVDLYETENLKTYVTWGDYNSIFQKAELFTILSQILVDTLKFENQIIINLTGSLTGETKYSIRIGHKQENRYNRRVIPIIEDDNKAIVITILSSNFSIERSLKILEYAITEYDRLKKTQGKLKPYSVRDELAINQNLVNQILSSNSSEAIESTLDSPIQIEIGFMKLFLKNGKFCFQSSQGIGEEYPILLELEDVYQIKAVGNETFVFDSDSTFYCLDDSKNPRMARHHVIKKKWFYGAYSIKNIGSKFYAIYFEGYLPESVYSEMLTQAGIDPENKGEAIEALLNGTVPWFYSKTLIYDFESDSIIIEDLNKLK